MSEIEVRDVPDRHRYEVVVDGAVAGFAQYRLSDDVITFLHTEVDSEYEGQGVGSTLARHSLDEVREHGVRKVKPLCPFYKSYIDRHPDYADLLAS